MVLRRDIDALAVLAMEDDDVAAFVEVTGCTELNTLVVIALVELNVDVTTVVPAQMPPQKLTLAFEAFKVPTTKRFPALSTADPRADSSCPVPNIRVHTLSPDELNRITNRSHLPPPEYG